MDEGHESEKKDKINDDSKPVEGAEASEINEDQMAEDINSPRSGGLPAKKSRSRSPAAAFLTAASPPRFVSFEELMSAADSAANMALAHEIAVDNNFKLEKFEAPEKSLERQVKETMFRAFWDSLQEKLDRDPPDYSHALTLLQEVKEMLFSLLMPSQDRLKQHINDHIDMEVIKKQLEKETLDLKEYANFITGIMAKLCAPARDEQVAALRLHEKPVQLFKHIFEVLEVMKMDMANFTIMQMRPYIQQQSVQYERAKFQQFLDTQRSLGVDGLELTRSWIEQSFQRLENECKKSGAASTITPRDVLNEAYMDLLYWNERDPFPETMVMDESRFLVLGDQLRRLSYISAVILVTCNLGGQSVSTLTGFKKALKEHITIILQDISSTEGMFRSYHLLMPQTVDPKIYASEFIKHLDSIADQVVKDTNEALQSVKLVTLDENRQLLLRTQIKEAVNRQHPVNKLISDRLHNFVKTVLSSEHKTPLQLPQGLSSVGQELSELCGALMRLIAHNRAVFSPYYSDIIESLMKTPAGSSFP